MTACMHHTRPALSLLAGSATLALALSLTAAPTGDPATPATPPAQPAPAAPAEAPRDATPDAPKDLPAAKEIQDASVKAMGGKEAIDKIQSVSAKFTIADQPVTAELKSSGADRFLFTQSMGGMPMASIGWNGELGWVQDARAGGYKLMQPIELAMYKSNLRQQIDMHGLVFHLTDEFPTSQVVDRVPFAGEDCHKMRLVDKNGAERFGYFSASEALIRGMEQSANSPQGEVKITMKFEDWQKRGDVNVFTKVTVAQSVMDQSVEMKMLYDEIEFDKVDPAAFEPPAEVQELVKQRDQAPASKETPAAPAPPSNTAPPPTPPPAPEPPTTHPK